MSDLTGRTTAENEDGAGRRRLVRILFVLAVIAMLSLCSWSLFWPVPEDVLEGEAGLDRSISSGDGLVVSNVKSAVLTDVTPPRKAAYACVSFEVLAKSADTPFNITFITLQLDSVKLPPVEGAEFDRWTEVPAMINAGETGLFSVVFAVPVGSMDATLTVQTSRLSNAQAPSVPIRLRTEGDAQ